MIAFLIPMHHKFTTKKKAQFSEKLVKWYRTHYRDLPWRNTKDPYRIWLSEIMLQQTTVAQGTDYYHRFLTALPTLTDLAQAPLDQVLKLWEGLGYYSRARNLHATAIHIHKELDGQFPDTYDSLLNLKGVGTYTAAAIASFVYDLPHVVVDGNVLRVISRLHGIIEPVDLPFTKELITQLAQELLEFQRPEEFNQAIMEFGALCCTYKNPSCDTCPFKKSCVAYKKKVVSTIPLKSKKVKKKSRYFHLYTILDEDDSTLIYQRKSKDVWQGLYAFPLIEVETYGDTPPPPGALASLKLKAMDDSETYRQTLTHQYIHARFHYYRMNSKFGKIPKEYKIQSWSKLAELAFPKIINNYLQCEPRI